MLNGMKAKALLIGTMAISILISGCGVKKDSDDKVMLLDRKNITEVTSGGKKNLLDISKDHKTYWQYDSVRIFSYHPVANVRTYQSITWKPAQKLISASLRTTTARDSIMKDRKCMEETPGMKKAK